MKPARKLLRKLIKEELSEYMIKGFDVKEFVDEALKKSGIKVTKYLPMKSGWLGGKFVWGAFYTVKANKRKDVLPFTVDKQGNLHLNVSPETYIVCKVYTVYTVYIVYIIYIYIYIYMYIIYVLYIIYVVYI